MQQVKKIMPDLFWIGGSDRRLALFENVFPIEGGVCYNSYFVDDDKTIVMDCVDKAVSEVFFENIAFLLNGRKLDYVVINHMEPDHCASLGQLVLHYPEVKIVGNAKTFAMMKRFFDFDVDSHAVIVKEGDTLTTGKHTFTFVMAPMVHWPEAMVCYDTSNQVLYSADAFGTFNALNGQIFADQMNLETDWLPEARRYYANIVGKYGMPVQSLLNKAANLKISMICPLHGPIWRKNLDWVLDIYQKWSSYTPEDQAVMIAYASIYGNTEQAANILASELDELGVKDIVMYDVSKTHPSVIVSEAFRCSHLVFASPTYNAGIFCNMETVLHDIQAHNLQNRTVALIENGSWAPVAAAKMKDILASLKNIRVLDGTVSIMSSVKEKEREGLHLLAKQIVESLQNI